MQIKICLSNTINTLFLILNFKRFINTKKIDLRKHIEKKTYFKLTHFKHKIYLKIIFLFIPKIENKILCLFIIQFEFQ